MSDILALIPAYNEVERIAPVVQGALLHLPVLVVDDGSTDGTADAAEGAGATVVCHEDNRGKGAALKTGFGWALRADFGAVLTLDADAQHDPAEIPGFVEAYAARGADLIVGTRDFVRMPLTRRIANTVGRVALSWALGRRVEDNQSGYRLLSRRLIDLTLDSPEEGYEFEVEMLVQAVLHTLPVEWLPIRTIYAGESSHIRPWRHTVNFFRLVARTRRRLTRP
jgi:glycosyltransferase involved in cell wall biosynthesis